MKLKLQSDIDWHNLNNRYILKAFFNETEFWSQSIHIYRRNAGQ